MWGNSHSCLTWNKFDCTNTSKSDLAFPSACDFSPSSRRLQLRTGLGTEPIHCSALTRSGHPRLKMGISRERLPAPKWAHLVLPGVPSHTAAVGVSGICLQQHFHSWVDSIRLLDKKWPGFSELLSVLKSQQSLRVLHFEYFTCKLPPFIHGTCSPITGPIYFTKVFLYL